MSTTQRDLPPMLGAWVLGEEAAAAELEKVEHRTQLGAWARGDVDMAGSTDAAAVLAADNPEPETPELTDAELEANKVKAETERAQLAATRAANRKAKA